MTTDSNGIRLLKVCEDESIAIIGGAADKDLKTILYHIGKFVGNIARCIVDALCSKGEHLVSPI